MWHYVFIVDSRMCLISQAHHKWGVQRACKREGAPGTREGWSEGGGEGGSVSRYTARSIFIIVGNEHNCRADAFLIHMFLSYILYNNEVTFEVSELSCADCIKQHDDTATIERTV